MSRQHREESTARASRIANDLAAAAHSVIVTYNLPPSKVEALFSLDGSVIQVTIKAESPAGGEEAF